MNSLNNQLTKIFFKSFKLPYPIFFMVDNIINNRKIIVMMEIISILLIIPTISFFILTQPSYQTNSINISNQNEEIPSVKVGFINKTLSSPLSYFEESISTSVISKEKKAQLKEKAESKEYKIILKKSEFTNISKGKENIINIMKSQIQKQKGIFNDTDQNQNNKKIWFLDTKKFELYKINNFTLQIREKYKKQW